MNKYNISNSDLIESGILEVSGNKYKAQDPPRYIKSLMHLCGELFQCEHYLSTTAKFSGNSLIMSTGPVYIGFDPNVSICKYTYDTLSRKLINARKEFRTLLGGSWKATLAADSYALGWVTAVENNIQHLIPPPITIEQVTETGLILFDPLKDYLKNMDLNKAKKSEKRDLNAKAYHLGQEDGKEVDVYHGVRNNNLLKLNK